MNTRVFSIRSQRIMVWSALIMSTIFGVAWIYLLRMLPPLFWGIAAFTPERAPELTSLMHEIACLTLVTTDQYYDFNFLAVAFIALRFLESKQAGDVTCVAPWHESVARTVDFLLV